MTLDEGLEDSRHLRRVKLLGGRRLADEACEILDSQRLAWVAYIGGKRESRRLLGDIILTQQDVQTPVTYPDSMVTATWTIDLHYPEPENTKAFPGQEFRTVAQFTYDWEYWIGPDGIFRYNSPSCERVTGYAPGEFMADPGLRHRIVFPEDREVWDAHRHEKPVPEGIRSVQFRIRRKDGAVRWIEHSCLPVHDASGSFLGYRAGNSDITERKLFEVALAATRPARQATPAAAPERTRGLPADAPGATAGSLMVDSRPAGARVFVDGRMVGTTPMLLDAVTAEWLAEFERIQLMLRLSQRLRGKHGD